MGRCLCARTSQAALDELLARQASYPKIMVSELDRRLEVAAYLTCEDFALFDVHCCDSCHNFYPHYEMYVVELADGRMAWVCCPVRDVLLRKLPDPEPKIEEIFWPEGRPDNGIHWYRERKSTAPVYDLDAPSSKELRDRCDHEYLDALIIANRAAESDRAKLACCLRYVHHVYGRKTRRRSFEAIVYRAMSRKVCQPAISSKIA
jgi:hypothetical protein